MKAASQTNRGISSGPRAFSGLPAAVPKVKHRISGACLLEPPPGVPKRGRACPCNRYASSGLPCKRGGRKGVRKSSTGYPVLDFWTRCRGPRNRGGLAQATAGSPRFPSRDRARRRGAESQAPDIRCLAFGTAAARREAAAGLQGEPRDIQRFPGLSQDRRRGAKVKHRISGACLWEPPPGVGK